VEECTYFWGVNTSWGIDTAESKDLCIRKIIRLHNQHLSVSTIGIIAGYLQYSLTNGRKILCINGRKHSKWDSTI
jgi:hypothetical protein